MDVQSLPNRSESPEPPKTDSLESLPNELLALIAAALPKSALESLSRVNKHFRLIAVSFYFKSTTVTSCFATAETSTDFRRLYVLSRSEFARYVEKIHYKVVLDISQGYFIDNTRLPPAGVSRNRLIHLMIQGFADNWKKKNKDNFGLLRKALPHFENLTIFHMTLVDEPDFDPELHRDIFQHSFNQVQSDSHYPTPRAINFRCELEMVASLFAGRRLDEKPIRTFNIEFCSYSFRLPHNFLSREQGWMNFTLNFFTGLWDVEELTLIRADQFWRQLTAFANPASEILSEPSQGLLSSPLSLPDLRRLRLIDQLMDITHFKKFLQSMAPNLTSLHIINLYPSAFTVLVRRPDEARVEFTEAFSKVVEVGRKGMLKEVIITCKHGRMLALEKVLLYGSPNGGEKVHL
ncbi:hypothetical protein AJ79_07045 [Helicocarpus griseus UAMH5409]|uniref:F-box domain-containing protein n=1 Tax=Helicocarpus griseus UAMH5409 TaxID=1447875 RepID=A0A2B7X6J1_9EURO|nr:hypothetical protein AJ79_07045 [Helicocarpus griseus UAMH5409]